jgi:ABC-type uncharacterized transport system involved in gliding motility auxiliary subunit
MATGSTSKSKIAAALTAVVIMGALLIGINFLLRQAHIRQDLTADRLYTLSPGTIAILKKVESPVELHFYFSRSSEYMPPHEKVLALRIDDLLREYELANPAMIKVRRYDPAPDSNEEKAAETHGVRGRPLMPMDGSPQLYLGLAATCLDQTRAIPIFDGRKEKTLEYDLTHLIYQVSSPKKPVIGVLTSVPAMGSPGMQMGGMMPPQGRRPPWQFITELKLDFDVRTIEPTVDVIPEDISCLVIVHPRELSETTLYAIDQYIVGGGNTMVFLDPVMYFEQEFNPQPNNPMMQMQPPGGPSSLDPLLSSWGLSFDTTKVLVDKGYALMVGNGQEYPMVPIYSNAAMNSEDITIGALEELRLFQPGAFSGTAVGLEQTVLLKSSKDSQLMDTFKTRPGIPLNDFKSADHEHPVALRLTGTFTSAYPDGPPPAEGEEEDAAAAPGGHLKTGEEDAVVVLFADADMLYDQAWIENDPFRGARIVAFDNNNFFRNGVEQLSGNEALISIRSRGVTDRPLEAIHEKRRELQRNKEEEEKKLQEKAEEAAKELQELLQTDEQGNQVLVFSPDVRAKFEELEAKKKEADENLRQARLKTRKQIDRLKSKVMWLNVLGVPAIVLVFGLALAGVRRLKMGQRA